MPQVPLPTQCRIFTQKEWWALGEALFGKDRDTWTFQCQHCGEISTRREGASFWKHHANDPHHAGQRCPKCQKPAVPGQWPELTYRVLLMPEDCGYRPDVGENGVIIYAMPFWQDHLSQREVAQAVNPIYQFPGHQIPEGASQTAPRFDLSIQEASLPPMPMSSGDRALATILNHDSIKPDAPPAPAQEKPSVPKPAPKPAGKKGGTGYGFQF